MHIELSCVLILIKFTEGWLSAPFGASGMWLWGESVYRRDGSFAPIDLSSVGVRGLSIQPCGRFAKWNEYITPHRRRTVITSN